MAMMRPHRSTCPVQWCIFLDAKCVPGCIGGIRSEDLPQMPGTDDQHVIQTLAPYLEFRL
jgi:hypothetical protein